MATQYLPILILVFVGILLASVFTLLVILFGPKVKNDVKSMPFESGLVAKGSSHKRYNIRFYLVAMVFLIFDVESILLYPWAVKFQALGWLGLAEITFFFAIFLLAFAYIWKKGAFAWE